MRALSAPASSRYAAAFTAIWGALALVRLASHEMWRDELQAWMIALRSDSVPQLISNVRYEGSPGLWTLFLFGVSRFTDAPAAMQVVNLLIGLAAVYVLIRFAPFPRWLSALLALGYYPAYEYGTISRSYGLGMLCIFASCALFSSRQPRKFALMAVTLSALALTSIYGSVVAVALAAGAAVDAWRHPTGAATPSKPRLWIFTATVAVGIVLAAVLVRQPADAGFDASPRLALEADGLVRAGASVWHGLMPLPPLSAAFWNRNLLDGLPLLKAALGCLLAGAGLLVLRRQPAAATVFAIGTIILLLFTYLIFAGGTRHHGHYFLLLVAACWIAAARHTATTGPAPWRPLLIALAIVHLAAGTFASAVDLWLPFSGSRAAAAHIARHYPADTPIVVNPEYRGVPMAAWLGRDVFFVQSNRWGGFVLWNDQRNPPSLDRAVEAADRLSYNLRRDVLVVVTTRTAPPPRFQHVGFFPSAVVLEEAYDVYVLRHRSGAGE